MNSRNILLVALFTVITVFVASAQKFKPAPVFLKGENQINVVFDYSKVTFDGDSQKEQYRDKGKKWVEEWEGKRRTDFNNSFIGSLNDELKKIGLTVDSFPDATYTMVVDVLDCDFGAYAGPMSVAAKVKATVKIVKTGATGILTQATFKESQDPYTIVGTPIDFDRMYRAFGELGEEVGDKIVNVLK
jgi:hypothetical protein